MRIWPAINFATEPIKRVMAQEQKVLASFADEFDADALESALRVTKMLTNRIQSYMKGP